MRACLPGVRNSGGLFRCDVVRGSLDACLATGFDPGARSELKANAEARSFSLVGYENGFRILELLKGLKTKSLSPLVCQS